MTLIPLTPGPDAPEPRRSRLDRPEAEALGERIQQQAAVIAEATCELLLSVADFDARGGVGWYVGLKSTAHWLSWACSMTSGTAREHVRVARALPEMPLTVAEFRAGRLSYSKVREISRVADRVEESMLVEMARAMTAAQLARTISSFRAVEGSRLAQDAVRQARWQTREDGLVEIRAVLPAEIGAEVITALDLALDRDGHDPERVDPDAPCAAAVTDTDDPTAQRAAASTTPTLEQRKADALHSLARTFLHAEPDDRSGEDRHLVIVQVSAETLTGNVPAGTPEPLPTADESMGTPTSSPTADVPAGTSSRCGVVGQGPLEPRTAERLACSGKVALMITDAGGEVLHLGRTSRLASRGQRRALRLRDTVCNFPGCHQSRHLDAHHTTPWSQGGATDIEGLALLCRRHHVMVHEGGLHLVPDPARFTPLQPRFQVVDEAGRLVQARWPAMLEALSVRAAPPARLEADVDADPERIAATTGGFGFRLADCVDVLCSNVVKSAA
ncbi:HNH endonuclease signature motif containing protein [Brachybacterium sp. FME24]|uniref:HNH endonuclease signature motif containing protein n=1 Tax=Brachybacterium sp. FME24 TaxID=2742605 RepID=UPI0018679C14|nr:HNH endonuclease signature motif containing protein [Brachybacterium sp. FME24]